MKFLITAVIVIGLSLGAWQIYQYYQAHEPATPVAGSAAPTEPQVSGEELPGLPEKLKPMLEAAQQRGAAGLREFLATYGKNVTDPRLAWIQLDYVLLVAPSDAAEARRIFAKVKPRIAPGSPAYGRLKNMAKTYDQGGGN